MSIKTGLFAAARMSGLNGMLVRTQWRRARLAILCYHGVSLDDEHRALPELYVTVAHLRRRFEMLRRGGFKVLPLGDALDRMKCGTLPSRSVALTFDDGTRDFALQVVPLLHEFGFPATVYVTTYYSEHSWPVFNTAMRYLLWRGSGGGADLSDILGVPLCLSRGGLPPWPFVLEAIERSQPSAAEKHAILDQTAHRIGVDFDAFLERGQFAIMTPQQLSELPRPLVDVQLHTHRHRAPRDPILFECEIEDNRASLRRHTGDRPLVHFCYPSGDYSAAFLPWLNTLGIQSATTCVPGLVSARSHPLLLPRFIDTSVTADGVFRACLDGVADLLPRRRKFRFDTRRI